MTGVLNIFKTSDLILMAFLITHEERISEGVTGSLYRLERDKLYAGLYSFASDFAANSGYNTDIFNDPAYKKFAVSSIAMELREQRISGILEGRGSVLVLVEGRMPEMSKIQV
jgi:hypothetical protein